MKTRVALWVSAVTLTLGLVAPCIAEDANEKQGETHPQRLAARDKAKAVLEKQVAKPEYGIGIESSMRKVFIEEVPFQGTFDSEIVNLSTAHAKIEIFYILNSPTGHFRSSARNLYQFRTRTIGT